MSNKIICTKQKLVWFLVLLLSCAILQSSRLALANTPVNPSDYEEYDQVIALAKEQMINQSYTDASGIESYHIDAYRFKIPDGDTPIIVWEVAFFSEDSMNGDWLVGMYWPYHSGLSIGRLDDMERMFTTLEQESKSGLYYFWSIEEKAALNDAYSEDYSMLPTADDILQEEALTLAREALKNTYNLQNDQLDILKVDYNFYGSPYNNYVIGFRPSVRNIDDRYPLLYQVTIDSRSGVVEDVWDKDKKE